VSTDEVYGSLGRRTAFTERHNYQPNSRIRVESRIGPPGARLAPHLRLPVLTTNCSNNYGPYQFPEKLIR